MMLQGYGSVPSASRITFLNSARYQTLEVSTFDNLILEQLRVWSVFVLFCSVLYPCFRCGTTLTAVLVQVRPLGCGPDWITASRDSFPPSFSVTKWSNTLKRGSRWGTDCCCYPLLDVVPCYFHLFIYLFLLLISPAKMFLRVSSWCQFHYPVLIDRWLIIAYFRPSCLVSFYCDTCLIILNCSSSPSSSMWAWPFTAASWKLTLRNSASISRAAPQIWWTRPMSGSSPRTATMTLTQSPKIKN